MSEARVESVDAIKSFRVAWLKFAEAANVALTDAEADAVHTLRWLETEQRTYWQNQVRKSSDLVSRCAEALRHKRIFKDSSGRTPSAVDEEKALAKAKRMKEIAEEKLQNIKKHVPRLGREIMLYKGQVQRLATFVASDIPTAASKLDKIVKTLESYVALQMQDTAAQQQPPMAQPIGHATSEATSEVEIKVEAPPPPPPPAQQEL